MTQTWSTEDTQTTEQTLRTHFHALKTGSDDGGGGLHEHILIPLLNGAHERGAGASDAEGERGFGKPAPSAARAVRGPMAPLQLVI